MNITSLPVTMPVGADGNSGEGTLLRGGAYTAFFPDSIPRNYQREFTDDAGNYELYYQEAGGSWIDGGAGNVSSDSVFPGALAFILRGQWSGTPHSGDVFTYSGNPESPIIPLPVLFKRTAGFATEVTTDFVNSLMDGRNVIAPAGYGPAGDGSTDILQAYAEAAFGLADQEATFVDARTYFNGEGSVHCATNVIRAVPSEAWWNYPILEGS